MTSRKPSVTVTGVGAAGAPPDLLVAVVGVECVAEHTGQALSAASTAIAAMRDVAVAAGVQPQDLATSGSQLWPDHDRQGRPSGYRAHLTLTVRVRELAAAAELVPALIEAGGDVARLHSTSLAHSDSAVLATAARGAAFADARARAEQYAALAGLALGQVLSVTETETEQRYPAARNTSAARAAPMSASLTVEAGTDEVAAAVTVCWRLV
jgi:uncharacterized protein YggE